MWGLADSSSLGFLTDATFATACRLISLAQNGHPVTTEGAGAKFRTLALPWATFDRTAAVPLPPSPVAVTPPLAPPVAEVPIAPRPVAVSIDDAFGEMSDSLFFASGEVLFFTVTFCANSAHNLTRSR